MDQQESNDLIELQRSRANRELSNWLPIVGVYIVFMLGNILLPTIFWRLKNGFWLESCAMILSGVLASEVGILGVWMALRSDRWTHRLLICVLLLGLIATCWLIGLQLPEEPGTMPMEVGLAIYGLSIVGWLSTWLALACLRACSGWYIGSPRDRTLGPIRTQVSIGYWFAAVTVIAGLIAIARAVMPSKFYGNAELVHIAIAGGFYIVYSLMLLIPSCWISLKEPTPYWLFGILLLELYFLGGLTIQCVGWYTGLGPFGLQQTAFFYEYSFGLIAASLLVFGWLRRCGFELRKA